MSLGQAPQTSPSRWRHNAGGGNPLMPPLLCYQGIQLIGTLPAANRRNLSASFADTNSILTAFSVLRSSGRHWPTQFSQHHWRS